MILSGAFRNLIRPLSTKILLPHPLPLLGRVSSPVSTTGSLQESFLFKAFGSSYGTGYFSTSTAGAPYVSLTDMRFPQRRPGTKPRKKRASLRPKGPYAWVQYVPGEPIPRSRPNEGSVQGRNEKKRIKQKKAYILAEKKKRKAQYAEARKRKGMERIERKMAAVAREKAWAERLVELQQLEEAKKAAMTSQ